MAKSLLEVMTDRDAAWNLVAELKREVVEAEAVAHRLDALLMAAAVRELGADAPST